SVGMLFDPKILLSHPLEILATVLIILVGKSAAAFGIVRAFRYSTGTALSIAASLAQIGEFSFIIAALGISLELLAPQARSLVVAGALLSITVNPFVLRTADVLSRRLRGPGTNASPGERPAAPTTAPSVAE